MVPDGDTESIERATLAAVPPSRLEEEGGWLLALDDGTVGRAHSAVPLKHEPPAPGLIPRIARRYHAAGLPTLLRMPRAGCFATLAAELQASGWQAHKPTLTQVAATASMARVAMPIGVALYSKPDDAWAAAFTGPGFDPADAASRLALLQRSQDTVYASVHAGAEAVAVGAACFAHGWIGVHGMRTAPGWRRRGLGAQVLAAIGAEGARRGIQRAFLQVEAGNTAAQALYARAGFCTAWTYDYWRHA